MTRRGPDVTEEPYKSFKKEIDPVKQAI